MDGEALAPLEGVLRVAPARGAAVQQGLGDGAEAAVVGRRLAGFILPALAFADGVEALAKQGACFRRGLAGATEGDLRVAAEGQVTLAAMEAIAQHPAGIAGGADMEMEAVAVGVAGGAVLAWLGEGADRAGGEASCHAGAFQALGRGGRPNI
jgi:hypothetical protein